MQSKRRMRYLVNGGFMQTVCVRALGSSNCPIIYNQSNDCQIGKEFIRKKGQDNYLLSFSIDSQENRSNTMALYPQNDVTTMLGRKQRKGHI